MPSILVTRKGPPLINKSRETVLAKYRSTMEVQTEPDFAVPEYKAFDKVDDSRNSFNIDAILKSDLACFNIRLHKAVLSSFRKIGPLTLE